MSDYAFRMPDGSTVSVRGWANLPMEIAGALAGVKPAIHAFVEKREAGYFKDLCARLKFSYKAFAAHDAGERERLEVILGPDAAAVEEAAVYWHHPAVNPGRWIGYPDCCVAFFRDWSAEARLKVGQSDYVDILPAVYAATKLKKEFSFLLNDAFYCYSRHWDSGDDEKRRALDARNPGLDLSNLNVITWHPCSYRCPASREAGRKIWKLLPSLCPELAAQARLCLSKPVLFWDWARFAVLKGRCGGPAECRYEGLHAPYSLLEAERVELLRQGDRVVLPPRGPAKVYRGRKLLGALAGERPLLLDFRDTV